jgi:hypothetical protein
MGIRHAGGQGPGSVQEADTRARSSSGGYPARGSSAILYYGPERSRQVTATAGGTLDQLPLPAQLGASRAGGIDVNKPRIRAALAAVLALAPSPDGFTVAGMTAKAQVHDPTTLNRQGNDIGTSYRSAVFYLSGAQERTAEETIADVDASGRWPGKVVTEVTAAGPFWVAEPEHQDYLERYRDGYTCHFARPGWKLPPRADRTS